MNYTEFRKKMGISKPNPKPQGSGKKTESEAEDRSLRSNLNAGKKTESEEKK